MKLTPYESTGKKTLRTNIDGEFTCKLDKSISLEKGEIVEVNGAVELYTVQRVIEDIPQNPSFEYYNARGYDEIGEFGLMKTTNLTELTLQARKVAAELIGEVFKENKYKENYEILGVSFQFDGRLNKNQVVRMGKNVIRITDLIKPKEKGGLIKVIGDEVDRVILDSVHRVYYLSDDKNYKVAAEYSKWGDALRMAYQARKVTGEWFSL